MQKSVKVKRTYQKSGRTKRRIYDAAISLMREKGFQGATVREICDHAGVSVGSFYSYFKTKSDILSDIYASADTFFLTSVTKELEGLDSVQKLRLFTRRYAELNVSTGLDLVRVLYNPENKWFSMSRPMQQVLTRILSEGQSLSRFRSDIPAEILTERIFDVLRGVCYTWCVNNAGFDLNERMQELLSLMIYGISSPAES